MSPKCPLRFLINLVGKAQAGVVHGKQEAFDFQLRVELRLYYAYCVEQLADTLEGEVFGLYGYDYRVGCRRALTVMRPRDGEQSMRI